MTADNQAKRPLSQPELTNALVNGITRKAYLPLMQILHDNKPSRPASREPRILTDKWRIILDAARDASDKIPETEKPLLYSMLYTGLEMDYTSFIRPSEEFHSGIETIRETSQYRIEQVDMFNALRDHPFAIRMRDDFMLLDRQDALETVKSIWDTGNTPAFLYVTSALTTIQDRMQRQQDPALADERFSESMASHPDLEMVVITVLNGNGANDGFIHASLPPLRIIVSNKPLAVDYSEDSDEEATREFTLVSASGTYSSLKDYMIAALSERRESIGHGPYYFTSNDDRCIATASNVIASTHKYLDTPTNFAFNAQERLKAKLQEMRSIAIGPIYAHRYLRSDKTCEWSEALNFARNIKNELKILDVRGVAETLVTHGMSSATNNLFMSRLDDNLLKEAHLGYLQGISTLHSDMVELLNGGDQITDALERFERYRGFHPDILMFPVEERNRLAFQDVSDILVAHITGTQITDEPLYDRQPLITDVDIPAITHTMIAGGDITNAMRIYENLVIMRNQEMAEGVLNKFTALGYQVMQEFKLVGPGKLAGRAVLDDNGNLYSRQTRKPSYLSVDQITSGEEIDAAKFALETLNVLKFPDQLENHKDEQISSLKDFIARKSLVKELKDGMRDVPDPLKPLFLDGVRLDAEDLADHLAMKGVRNPQDAVQQAISEASGTKPKAAFHRIMKALGNVSEIMKPKSK
jgi:hypothetical protein